MDKLFGVRVENLTMVLLVILALMVAVGALMAWRNPVLFKLGIRNIARRRAQTGLIVLGLMLAAMLFSAALSTGDTLTHSIRLIALDRVGNVDIVVRGESRETTGRPYYFDPDALPEVRKALDADPNVEGVVPFIHEQGPVVDPASRLSQPQVDILGMVDAADKGFDPLLDAEGKRLRVDALRPGEVYLSETTANKLNAAAGSKLMVFIGQAPTSVTVAGVYKSGGVPAYDDASLVMPLAELQELTGNAGKVAALLVTLKGDAIGGARHSDEVVDKLKPLLDGTRLTADPLKADTLKEADAAGATFASLFIIFGQFSVVAGILLIFLIFVMLAAERKRELGITRAIGAQASHVVRMFVFEGAMYALIASAIGAALGIAVGWGMVRIMAIAVGEFDLKLVHDFRPMSLLLAYLIGVVLTVAVVMISAWRVSRINIVRAIRDIPEPKPDRRSIRGLLFTLALLVLGALFAINGAQSKQMLTYLMGTSMVLIALPLLGRRFGLSERLAFTVAGGLLLFWWFLPVSLNARLFPFLPDVTEMNQNITMFFLSGIMVVLGAVWVVMYNSDIVLKALVLTFGRIQGMPAILKTAVSYPLANRFRTGMALAMFSLVVFTLVVMAVILNASNSVFGNPDLLSGHYDIRATVSYANPVGDMKAALAQSDPSLAANITAIGGANVVPVKVRQANSDQEYEDYFITGVDKGYTDSVGYQIDLFAPGYSSSAQVWSTLQSRPDLAVVSPMLVPARANYNFGGPASPFKLEGFYFEDGALPDNLYIEVKDPLTGAERRLQVIGVISQTAFYAFPLITSQSSVTALAGQPVPSFSYMIRVKDGADVEATAKALEARFLENGLQADVLREEIQKNIRTNLMFNNLLQGFMALGLVVGIAALGVIAARAVVERRQQIGVARAIGFQRGMVQASFLLESSFIALLGIGLGVALGMGLSIQIVDTMKEFMPGVSYRVPVANIMVVVVVAYIASLLTTFLPARQAANVYPAEALRYE